MTFYLTEVCRECGNLRSVCSDPNVTWFPQRSVCYATASRLVIERRTRDIFGHPEPTSPSLHRTDGLVWWMARQDLTPDDDFFGEALLVGGGLEQPNGDEQQPA